MFKVGSWYSLKSLMRRTPRQIKVLLLFVTFGFMLFLALFLRRNYHEPSHSVRGLPDGQSSADSKPIVWIYAKKEVAMQHVIAVFNRLGFSRRMPGEPWDVMWSHGYPFNTFQDDLWKLKPHQRLNHYPGTACFVSKPKLGTHKFSFTPKTFRIPEDSNEFLEEAKNRPETLWVQKGNKHRGIKIKKPADVSLRSTGIIVQEFISNPILIDGRKFDVGIYTLVTSIDPLIVYIYEEEVLVRFCSKEYLPFDKADKKRYVIDDSYTPSWEIPSMEPLVNKHGLTHKEALNIVLQRKGFDSAQFWGDAYSIIQKVLQHCETSVLNKTASYASKRNFFEFVRFDFIIDEDFKTWLMEVNLSPNLSSAHTEGNRNMYEQLVYNVLHLVGLNRGTLPGLRYNGETESVMFVNIHDIQIPMDICMDNMCSSCNIQLCQLCNHCRGESLDFTLKTAFLEYISRRNFQRLIPAPFEAGCPERPERRSLLASKWSDKMTRTNNELIEAWFYGKCCQFPQWCR